MALRQHQRKGRGLEIRRSIHDERRNHSVGINPKVFGSLVRFAIEIYQASLEGNAEMDKNPVDREACPARRIVEGVHRAPPTGLFRKASETQAFGELLALTFPFEVSPGDEV